jgi:hypothetical protein
MDNQAYYQNLSWEQKREQNILDEVTNWSNGEIYSVFGIRLERIVTEQKEKLQLKLKTIWRNRTWYAYKDTGEQFDDDAMLYFFSPKKIAKYSLYELENILEKIESETNYSNPKTK